MTTLTAFAALDMTTGLADLNSDASLSQLFSIDPSGQHQIWAVSNGHGMGFDMTTTPVDTNEFANALLFGAGGTINLNTITLYTDTGGSTPLWTATGVAMPN